MGVVGPFLAGHARADCTFERGEPRLVEGVDGFLLQSMAVAVVVVLHPGQKHLDRLVRHGGRRLTGKDPVAEQLLDELTEAPVGVVELLGLLVASGDEGLQ